MQIKRIKDVRGNHYYAVDVPTEIVAPFQILLQDKLGAEYNTAFNNLKARQGEYFHITVCIPGIDKIDPANIESAQIRNFQFEGIGKAEDGAGNTAYYIVAKSADLDAICKANGIPVKHWHITLGFLNKDVHGVAKNVAIWKLI